MAQLIVTIEGEETTVDLVSGEIVSVGRDAGNTIALTDERKASRRHCQFTPVRKDDAEAWELTDLGATNKTRVNGKPTDRKVLTSGDVVQVGSVKMRFEDPQEESRLREAGKQGVCYVEWMSGGSKGEKVMLDQARVTMGRRDSNTIPLDDRMSSGHHCEITKDLNGYTIRDLGSTNGTLVNGEPTTETQLAHGMRIRVGNSRFVFKDPSMKDVEVELAQFEEDEGWGMMGDIDLTKARGSYAGLLIGLVILGAAAAGGWYITTQAEQRSGDVEADIANEIENGDMEDADFVLWGPETENENISVQISDSGKSGNGLSIRNGGDTGTPAARVVYSDEFDALADVPFRVEGWFRPRGEGRSQFVAIWRRRPRSLTETVPLAGGAGGWTEVDRTLVRPKWATSLQLGVLVDPGASANLDDVRVVRVTEGGPQLTTVTAPGTSTGYGGSDGRLDVVGRSGPLVVGARPVAMKGGKWMTLFVPDEGEAFSGQGGSISGTFVDSEEETPATIAWSTTEEGLKATVSCDGADATGVAIGLPRAVAGDRLSVLTPERKIKQLEAAGGQSAPAVVKFLAGSLDEASGRANVVAFIVNDEAGDAGIAIEDSADPALLTIVSSSKAPSTSLVVVTDFSTQRKLAQARLAEARRMLRERPGEGIELLRQLAAAFPFEKRLKEEALRAAQQREDEANRDLDALRKAFDAFRIYRSNAARAEAKTRLETMQSEFPPRADGSGSIEQDVAQIAEAFSQESRDYFEEFAGPELARLERLADMLRAVEGYEPMASLYLRAIVTEFGDLASDETPFGRRVLNAKKQLDEMMKNEKVATAVPPVGD